MKKIYSLFLVFILLSFSSVFAVVSHPASQIEPGSFQTGNYTFNGSIGIGTNTPYTPLHVGGFSDTPLITLGSSGTMQPVFKRNSGGGFTLDTNAAGSLSADILAVQYNSGSPLMVVEAGGNVGIGTSSPKELLHINSNDLDSVIMDTTTGIGLVQNAYYDGSWKFIGGGFAGLSGIREDNGQWNVVISNESGSADSAVTWTSPMTINADGNVGIGTTNPVVTLQVEDSDATITIRDTADYSIGSNGGRISLQGKDSNGNQKQFASIQGISNGLDSGDLILSTRISGTPTERMRIDKNGNVGIGTTTPGAYKLYVNGNQYINGNLVLSGTVDGYDISANAATWSADSDATNEYPLAGNAITVSTRTVNHADTSSQGSVNGAGRTYIQDVTLDGYGHVTGLATATETVVDTNTNAATICGNGYVLNGDGSCDAISSLSVSYASTSGNSATTTEVGAVTNGKWCVGDGDSVECTEDAPSGGGSQLPGRVEYMVTGQNVSYYAGDRGVGKSRTETSLEGGDVILNEDTNLMWIYYPATGNVNWATALQHCHDITTGGYTDWRLPNIIELISMIDYSKTNFRTESWYAFNDYYWTSTTVPSSTTYAYRFRMSDGMLSSSPKTISSDFGVRCVRG